LPCRQDKQIKAGFTLPRKLNPFSSTYFTKFPRYGLTLYEGVHFGRVILWDNVIPAATALAGAVQLI